MSDMLDRAVRAIHSTANGCAEGFDLGRLTEADAARCARAAIEAIREPTAAMVEARRRRLAETGALTIEDGWRAMIDEVLR